MERDKELAWILLVCMCVSSLVQLVLNAVTVGHNDF